MPDVLFELDGVTHRITRSFSDYQDYLDYVKTKADRLNPRVELAPPDATSPELAELFVSLVDQLLADGTIEAADFSVEVQEKYNRLKAALEA